MRAPTARRKPAKVVPANFVAPTAGWIANRALAVSAGAPGAAVLDNFFPLPTGAILRRGSVKRFSIGSGPVRSMFRYVSGAKSELFASISGPIHSVGSSTPSEVRPGGTNGDWKVQQFTTSGGTFLVGVNGTDAAWLYDGTTFSATTITFPSGSGLTTANLSYVWSHANRLWFAQKDGLSAWYLPVDQIGGELTELPLGGAFQRGGVLLFGQAWSVSAGGGLTDQNAFVTSEGEVAAYQGTDPGTLATWGLVGLYRIGKPLGSKAFVKAGGDVLVATNIGMISLATAAAKDFAALGAAAISYPIQEAWSEAVARRGVTGWRCSVWAEGGMLLVSPPLDGASQPTCFVANVNTGAWCRFTNWHMASIETFNGLLHFGDFDGNMWIGSSTGADNGDPYTGTCIPLFTDMGAPASRKIARNARLVKRSAFPSIEKVTAIFNFSERLPAAPAAQDVGDTSLWGSGVWGESVWGMETSDIVTSDWVSIGGSGHDVSVCVQITSGSLPPLDVELIRIDALFETAGLVS